MSMSRAAAASAASSGSVGRGEGLAVKTGPPVPLGHSALCTSARRLAVWLSVRSACSCLARKTSTEPPKMSSTSCRATAMMVWRTTLVLRSWKTSSTSLRSGSLSPTLAASSSAAPHASGPAAAAAAAASPSAEPPATALRLKAEVGGGGACSADDVVREDGADDEPPPPPPPPLSIILDEISGDSCGLRRLPPAGRVPEMEDAAPFAEEEVAKREWTSWPSAFRREEPVMSMRRSPRSRVSTAERGRARKVSAAFSAAAAAFSAALLTLCTIDVVCGSSEQYSFVCSLKKSQNS
mmetsp:Transcript_25602/g.84276  ORF Transcript_25602/g.84276 Transcript_25602/m.84276 type:complete len:295 (+) Transcript_25602:851-1735(+)